jgi:hypothetical protein
MNTTYTTWYDERTGSYEVVCWEDGKQTVVQRNIQTRAKAKQARDIWRLRQRELDAPAGAEKGATT